MMPSGLGAGRGSVATRDRFGGTTADAEAVPVGDWTCGLALPADEAGLDAEEPEGPCVAVAGEGLSPIEPDADPFGLAVLPVWATIRCAAAFHSTES